MAEKSDSSASPLPPAPLLPNFSTENETALLFKGDLGGSKGKDSL